MSTAKPTPSGSAKRELLLDNAPALFSRHGNHAVGIDAVLAKAGVAKMTLYNHFKSKEELIASVLERQAQAIAADITAHVAPTPNHPEKQILAVFDWLGDWFRSQDFQGCLFIKASGEYPEKKDLPHKVAVTFKQTRIDLLSSLSAQLPVAYPPALVRKRALLVEGAIVLAYIHRKSDPATDAREATKLLVSAAANR